MKINKGYLIAGLAALIGGIYYFGKKAVNQFSISFGSIAFDTPTITSINFQIALDIDNANNFEINFDAVNGSLLYGNKTIANFNSYNIKLPAKSTTTINFNGSISTIQELNNIIDIINSKNYNDNFITKINFVYGGGVVPITYTLKPL